ncbi:hypothetical protein [Poriferisphaera sp. WC338]|uniref:hypothetical protein n=1 Tax=Poriferisphaera sp. WC338 TaxID=3425129 RepID=UPI003D8187A5
MEMNADDAKRALGDIEYVMKQVKGRLSAGPTGNILMVWGAVWITCFALPYWLPQWAFTGWMIGNSLGILCTTIFVILDARKRKIVSNEMKQISLRIGWAWGSLFIFLFFMMAIISPLNWPEESAVLVIMLMFMYVIMGLWLRATFLFAVGWFIAIAACLGYFLMKWGWLGDMRNYTLWLALICGGTLFTSGFYIKRRWSPT